MPRTRGYREGTIRLRVDGRWEARLRRGPGQKPRYFFGHSKRDVQLQLADARRDHERGVLGASRNLTVEQYLKWWLEEVAQASVRPRTFERYQQIVRTDLTDRKDALGSIPLERLGPEPIQSMVNRLAARGRAPEKPWVVLRTALNVAVANRRLGWNPAEQVRLPRRQKRNPRFLSFEEANALRAAAAGGPLEALYVLALACPMRQGELLGLRWSDVDLVKREIRIDRQLQAIKHDGRRRLELVDVKSATSHRPLPLPDIAVDALRAHRERQEARRVTSLHGLVFTTGRGTPIGPRNLLRSFKALLVQADLPAKEIRFHDLRHSCATFLVASGVDPKTVQALLGHTTIRLTMDTYVHPMDENLRKAAQVMDRVLRAAELSGRI